MRDEVVVPDSWDERFNEARDAMVAIGISLHEAMDLIAKALGGIAAGARDLMDDLVAVFEEIADDDMRDEPVAWSSPVVAIADTLWRSAVLKDDIPP